jgi:hypothetical protein
MGLATLRCGMVGKWTGGAVGAETGMLIGGCKVFGQLLSQVPIIPIVYPVSCLPACRQPSSPGNRAMAASTAYESQASAAISFVM